MCISLETEMKHNAKGLKKAWYCNKPSKYKRKINKYGKDYENKVFNYLKHKGFEELIKSPWICWIDSANKYRAAEPDIVIKNVDQKHICIFEVKAWNFAEGLSDLTRLYIPIYRRMYPDYKITSYVVNTKRGKPLQHIDLEDCEDGEIVIYRYSK